MDYEEKLRLAKKALESGSYDKDTIEYIFPELKESEEEQNIKNLIDELKCSLRAAKCQNDACDGGHEKRINLLEWSIAWLEKQEFFTKKDIDDAYLNGVCAAKHELEKQGEKSKTNTVPKSHDEDKRFINILQNIVKGACSKYGIKWKGVDTSEKDLLAWIETHIYTEEDLTNAYECADQVQYKIGYDDAKKRIEEKLSWCQGDDDMVAAALKFAHEYGRHGLWSWLKSLKERIGVQDEQKSEGC